MTSESWFPPAHRAKEDVCVHGRILGLVFHLPARCLRGLVLAWSGAAAVLVAWSGDSYWSSAAEAAQLFSWRRLLGALFTRECVRRSTLRAAARQPIIEPGWQLCKQHPFLCLPE
jgi:hypothetical protein